MSKRISSSREDDFAGRSLASNLPATYSLPQLVVGDTDARKHHQRRLRGGDNASPESNPPSRLCSITCHQGFSVAVLCFVNLINYMDRFIIASVLDDVQNSFKIDNDRAGLLQTAFIVFYMVFAPLFGYLGDRYSRRWLMIVGVFLWSGTTLLGSFVDTFGLFITLRAMVGIGEASYSTIAPTIISDLFVSALRSQMLAILYFAIPVGSGLGYMVGSTAAKVGSDWRWSLRVTPILGVIAVILLFLIKEPHRGESEGTKTLRATSYCTDIKKLVKNISFILSTGAFACVSFMTGALSWWGPMFIHLGIKTQPGSEKPEFTSVAFTFGCITMIAGLLGVPLGSILSTLLRKRYPAVDPIICGIGVLVSVPLLTGACLLVSTNTIVTYFLIFFGQLTLNLNWAVVSDILLYIVVPTRRSTAEALQILVVHTLGDAGSPYIVGAISIAIRRHLNSPKTRQLAQDVQESQLERSESFTETVGESLKKSEFSAKSDTKFPLANDLSDIAYFESLQYALFCPIIVQVLGGLLFLFTACFVVRDKLRADQETLEASKQQP